MMYWRSNMLIGEKCDKVPVVLKNTGNGKTSKLVWQSSVNTCIS